jgi:hypothetical protein
MLRLNTPQPCEFDERREIWRLLTRAPKETRIRWLKWCCKQVSGGGVETRVLESSGEAGEVYHEALSLVVGSTLDVHRAGEKLVEMVKRSGG